VLVRVVDKDNATKDTTAIFTVTGFDKAYIADPNAIDLSHATVTGNGNTLTIKGMVADGKSYDVQAQWNTGAQGMQFSSVNAAASQSGGSGGACVSVPWIASGREARWNLSGNSGGVATSGTIETTYLSVSTTGVRTQTHSTTSAGGFTSVSDSTVDAQYHVTNDLLYVERFTLNSTSTAMGFTFSDRTETSFQPAYLSGPAGRFCEGQSWTSPAVAQTIVSTTAGSRQENTQPFTGRVQSIGIPVTTPLGSYTAVKVRTEWNDGSATIVWIDTASGVMVRQEEYDPSGVLFQTTELAGLK